MPASELKAYFSGELANSRRVDFYAASIFKVFKNIPKSPLVGRRRRSKISFQFFCNRLRLLYAQKWEMRPLCQPQAGSQK